MWTCFGLPGESFGKVVCEPPASTVKYLAKIGGKRGLFRGAPLNTNLCYSNPAVRRRIAEAVAQRCKEIPDVDYMQVWLADSKNNQCECEKCQAMRPSDWYVMILNEIDEKLTKMKLDTKIVFLMYVDLLWSSRRIFRQGRL